MFERINKWLDDINFKGMVTPSGKKLHDVWHHNDWLILIDDCYYPTKEDREKAKSIHRLNLVLKTE